MQSSPNEVKVKKAALELATSREVEIVEGFRHPGGRPREVMRRDDIKHNDKKCLVCRLPRSIKLRIEEDFVNWGSTGQIVKDLQSKGHSISSATVYRHMQALKLDVKRTANMDRGISRIVDKGFALMDQGILSMRAADLLAALTLQAKLKGMLSDNQAINNILIRNNIPTLEDIAKIKDKGQLGDRAAQIIKELQEAGALPKETEQQLHYNRVKEILANKISKDDTPAS